MCGIVGYIGKKPAASILLEGLHQLEYRGYDSAGLSLLEKNKIRTLKAVGKVSELDEKMEGKEFFAQVGIAHTRWATHGKPLEKNAHPHQDCTKKLSLVHNGIIENYQELKNSLSKNGHKFSSDTDSEVIAHLIEDLMKKNPFEKAVILALKRLKGTYGLVVMNSDDPERLIAARNSSPLVLGVGDGEFVLASDASAIIRHTKQVVYLNDEEVVVLTPDNFIFKTLSHKKLVKKTETLEWSEEQAKKQGFSHFMLKEIFEQPHSVEDAMRGRLIIEEGRSRLGGLTQVENALRKIERIVIISCGTSYHAGLIGEYMIEEYAGIPVEVEYASEFRYRKPLLDKKTGVLAISQSGETADTLAAIREAKQKGALTLGIVNVVGSTIARETDAGVYNHAGPEIAVASTKAFTSQLTILALFALYLGRQRQMSLVMGQRIAKEIQKMPRLIKKILENDVQIRKIAKKFARFENYLYLGRKYEFPIALEGALKIKEISYVHAEGYAAGEMKHGPIALIDKNFPSVVIVPKDSVYEKTVSGIEEIKARDGKVLVVTTKGTHDFDKLADGIIEIPKTLEMLTPLLSVIPLQLFAYYVAVERKLDVDKPRNLAKSVTVE